MFMAEIKQRAWEKAWKESGEKGRKWGVVTNVISVAQMWKHLVFFIKQ